MKILFFMQEKQDIAKNEKRKGWGIVFPLSWENFNRQYVKKCAILRVLFSTNQAKLLLVFFRC
jgi:hypothetical protein